LTRYRDLLPFTMVKSLAKQAVKCRRSRSPRPTQPQPEKNDSSGGRRKKKEKKKRGLVQPQYRSLRERMGGKKERPFLNLTTEKGREPQEKEKKEEKKKKKKRRKPDPPQQEKCLPKEKIVKAVLGA